jgi:hypothetical protein
VIRHQRLCRLWPAFTFLILAGLAKENFILWGLALIFWTVVHIGPSRLRRRDWGLLLSVLMVGLIDLAIVMVKVMHHGGVYPQQRSVATALAWSGVAISSLERSMFLVVGTILVAALAVRLRAHWSPRFGVELAILAVVLCVTQIAFYAGSPQAGRYLYPISLVAVSVWAVVAAGCRLLPNRRLRLGATIAMTALLILPISRGLVVSRSASEQSATTNAVFNRQLAEIEQKAFESAATAVLLQPYEPETDYERVLSLSRFITTHTGLRVMTLAPTHPSTAYSRQLAATMSGWSRGGTSTLVPYRHVASCLSITFGSNEPLCPESAPSPG